MSNILIVAAHPDDELLGMGATIAKIIQKGNNVYLLFLATGVYARGRTISAKEELKELRKHTANAGKILGVKKKNIFFENYPDNAMDSVSILDVVNTVESFIKKVKPSVIYTHHYNDLNIDHQLSFRAVLTASRPVKNNIDVISFEVPSSTEWNYPYLFSPNYFVDVSDTYSLKLKAMQEYKNEIRNYPHPRSLEVLDAYMTRWGSVIGVKKAEAFEIIRKFD